MSCLAAHTAVVLNRHEIPFDSRRIHEAFSFPHVIYREIELHQLPCRSIILDDEREVIRKTDGGYWVNLERPAAAHRSVLLLPAIVISRGGMRRKEVHRVPAR